LNYEALWLLLVIIWRCHYFSKKHHVYFFYFYGTAWEAFSYCLGPIVCVSKHGVLLSFFLWFHFLIYRGKDSHYLYPCVFCTKRTKPKERRKLDGDNNKHIRKYLFKNFMIKVKEGDVICGACRLRHYKCRTCSDRQATCEHCVVSDDNVYIYNTVSDYLNPWLKTKVEESALPTSLALLLF
jgi:hypothetical protein